MTTITHIDRAACRTIREHLQELVNGADDLGLNYSVGNARYSRDGRTATFKIDIVTLAHDVPGDAIPTKEAVDFERYRHKHNLPADLLGQTVTVNGTVYTIAGYRPRSRKYPIVAYRVSDRKGFKLPISSVKLALAGVL